MAKDSKNKDTDNMQVKQCKKFELIIEQLCRKLRISAQLQNSRNNDLREIEIICCTLSLMKYNDRLVQKLNYCYDDWKEVI